MLLGQSNQSLYEYTLPKHIEQSHRMSKTDYDSYALGDWHLQCGAALSNAHIAYKTFGDPKAPAIVYPTWYSGCFHS